MSPPNMHFHDNYLLPYCPTAVSNLEIPPTWNMHYAVPPPHLQYPHWCVPHRTFMHAYTPQNMEYQNPVMPKRVSEECGASTKKLKFSIESILGLSDEGNVTSTMDRTLYENCSNENLDPGHQFRCCDVPSYLPSEHRDDNDASPPPSCNSDASGSPDRGNKQKRMRTIFTPEQLQRLEQEFARQQYLVGDERLYLAECLGLTETQVKVWFQNRRIKYRREVTDMEKSKLSQLQSSEIKIEEQTFCQEMSPSSSEETENTLS